MKKNDLPVFCLSDIDFNVIRARLSRVYDCSHGIFGVNRSKSSVSYYIRASAQDIAVFALNRAQNLQNNFVKILNRRGNYSVCAER